MSAMALFEAWKFTKVAESWRSDTDFWVQAHCEIRSRDHSGSAAILVNVYSPHALEKMLSAGSFNYRFGRGYMIVNDYDERSILAAIQKLVEGTASEDWHQLTDRLALYFDWI